MKRVYVILVGLILLCTSCSSMQHIVRNGIEGIVISKKQKSMNFFYDEKDRFTPTVYEIDAFEKEVALIPELDSLKSFPRQYAGYVNEKTGNKCLFVILINKRYEIEQPWKIKPVEVQDGDLIEYSFDLKTHKMRRIEQ